jgi:hypothetical protein
MYDDGTNSPVAVRCRPPSYGQLDETIRTDSTSTLFDAASDPLVPGDPVPLDDPAPDAVLVEPPVLVAPCDAPPGIGDCCARPVICTW